MTNADLKHTYLLIVDDHAGLRHSLKNWFKSKYSDLTVLEASTGEEALRQVWKYPIQIILMDIGLPGISGIEATQQIKMIAPEIEIIMITIQEPSVYQSAAQHAGASYYIHKQRLHSELAPVLDTLLATSL